MKLITFLILLISFSAIQCAVESKTCVKTDFGATEIFDTTVEKVGLRNKEYLKIDPKSYCFVSFYVPLPEQSFEVKQMSDCSQHFRGKVKAGEFPGALPKGLDKRRCYFQHDWLVCVCEKTFCNDPQYWSLMLSRFVHGKKHRADPELADRIKQSLQITDIKSKKSGTPTHMKCFMWFADTIGQEDPDPSFYLYNYITTRHDAPPLADALSTAPRLKFRKHFQTPIQRAYIEEPEPFEDGTMEKREIDEDDDEEDFDESLAMHGPGEVTVEEIAQVGIVLLVIGMVLLLGSIGGTVVLLRKFCRRVMDHSEFSRKKDPSTLLRYERLYAADTVPKEFTRRKKDAKGGKDKKKGPSSPKKKE